MSQDDGTLWSGRKTGTDSYDEFAQFFPFEGFLNNYTPGHCLCRREPPRLLHLSWLPLPTVQNA